MRIAAMATLQAATVLIVLYVLVWLFHILALVIA